MAMTFRAFFAGLAETLPQAVQLMYQYEMYQSDKEFKEKTLALQGEDVMMKADLYATQREAAQFDLEQKRALASYELDAAEDKAETARLAKLLQQGEVDGIRKEFGSIEEYFSKLKRLDYNAAIANIDRIKAETSSAETIKIANELQAELVRLQKTSAIVDMANMMTIDPKSTELAVQAFELYPDDPTQAMAYVSEQGGKIYGAEFVKIVNKVNETMVSAGLMDGFNAVERNNNIQMELLNAFIDVKRRAPNESETLDIQASTSMFTKSLESMPPISIMQGALKRRAETIWQSMYGNTNMPADFGTAPMSSIEDKPSKQFMPYTSRLVKDIAINTGNDFIRSFNTYNPIYGYGGILPSVEQAAELYTKSKTKE